MSCGAALRVSSGNGSFAFLLQAFSFSNKKKMPKRGSVKSLIIVGREDRVQILHSYRAARAATVRRVAAPYKLSISKQQKYRRAFALRYFDFRLYLCSARYLSTTDST